MNFYYHRSLIIFYLFFTDLRLFIRIHNKKIVYTFKSNIVGEGLIMDVIDIKG